MICAFVGTRLFVDEMRLFVYAFVDERRLFVGNTRLQRRKMEFYFFKPVNRKKRKKQQQICEMYHFVLTHF